jgi:hypothetical protein
MKILKKYICSCCKFNNRKKYNEVKNISTNINYFSLKGLYLYGKIGDITNFDTFDLYFKLYNKSVKFKCKLHNILNFHNISIIDFNKLIISSKIYYVLLQDFDENGVLNIVLYNDKYDVIINSLSINDIIMISNQSDIL